MLADDDALPSELRGSLALLPYLLIGTALTAAVIAERGAALAAAFRAAALGRAGMALIAAVDALSLRQHRTS